MLSKFIKGILMHDPLIVPKHLGKVISKEELFVRNVTYINEFGYYAGTKKRPIDGEIGVYDGRRIVINLNAK